MNGNSREDTLTFGGTLNITARGGTAVYISSILEDYQQDAYCGAVAQAYLSSGGIDLATANISQTPSGNPGAKARADYGFTANAGSSYAFEGWGRQIS